MFCFSWLLATVTMVGMFSGSASADKVQPARRIFVLHSGLHTIFSDPNPDRVSHNIRKFLIKHGVPQEDIVHLDNPFPMASWKKMVPREGVDMFLASISPASKVSQEAYLRLHQALAQHKVGPEDQLIWVGHSAGGQIGLTLAHLSQNLNKYPDLARLASPHPFAMVFTLGAPLGSNPLPEGVMLRHYFSPQDRVVHWACLYGTFALGCLGYPFQLNELPPGPSLPSGNLDKSARGIIRIFQGVEHPYWDEERVVLRILAEFQVDYHPFWQTSALPLNLGPNLAGLLGRALEKQCQLSLEDPWNNGITCNP